jgi:hypothetical protein
MNGISKNGKIFINFQDRFDFESTTVDDKFLTGPRRLSHVPSRGYLHSGSQ